MDRDFHYYATYLAAATAGFKNSEARIIATAAQFIDDCTEAVTYESTRLGWQPHEYRVKMESGPDHLFYPLVTSVYGMTSWVPSSNNDETRQIWMPFHFLPGNYPNQNSSQVVLRDVDLSPKIRSTPVARQYLDPAENIDLLCRPRSDTSRDMINSTRASYNKMKGIDAEMSLMLIGCTMHVFADTYAHQDFSGTPSWNLNGTKNTSKNPGKFTNFGHWEGLKWVADKTTLKDITWPVSEVLTGDPLTTYPPGSFDVTSLGHGKMGHLPDVSTIYFEYDPQWSEKTIERNNPTQYMNAFVDMVNALSAIRGNIEFNWFASDDEEDSFASRHSGVINDVKQLFCPDNKKEIDQKMYEMGLDIEGREWFLFSEQRWSDALVKLCNSVDYDPIPGYNEAKYSWSESAVRKKLSGDISCADFINEPFIKWNVSAKILFKNNYLSLRTKQNGLMRILRKTGFSSTMDPRQVLIDEFDLYWIDATEQVNKNNTAILTAMTTDKMDNALLAPLQGEGTPCSPKNLYKGWKTLKANDGFISYVEESVMPAVIRNKTGYIASVSSTDDSARAVVLIKMPDNDSMVYLRTLENQPGSYLYFDFPTSIASTAIYYNDFQGSINQQWKLAQTYDEEAQLLKISLESVKYPGWYLSHNGSTVVASKTPMNWLVSDYNIS